MVSPTLSTSPFERYVSPGPSSDEPWDEVLFETESFVVVPTAGSIVEGWLLVVPKVDALAFADVVGRRGSEAEEVLSVVRKAVKAVYGSSVVFEHGPSRPGTQAGCTVDPAHLQVLPSVADLEAGACELMPSMTWEPMSGVRDLEFLESRSRSYLYLDEGNPMVALPPHIPSQLFRRVIARAVGRGERYDWRTHPDRENAEATVRRLGPVLRRRS
jgi:diadenosine tetraphosphate (Ap4A) HIT family hydrolase